MDRQDETTSRRGGQGATRSPLAGFGAAWYQRWQRTNEPEPHNALRAGTACSKSDDTVGSAAGWPEPNLKMPNLVLASGHFDPRARERSSGDGLNGLSSPEIAQLVSAALENALLALGDEDPSEFLQLRAVDSRREMRQTLRSLPQAEAECPTVQADYRKAVVFQNVALNLAFEIMHAIDRYARAVDVAAEPRDR